MSKEPKTRVSQLSFTFGFPKDEAQATQPQDNTAQYRALDQENGPATSIVSLTNKSTQERKKKHHSLYDKVFALENLSTAWVRVAANKGAAGVDGVTIAQFGSNSPLRLSELRDDLRNKSYRPQPVRRVYIAKTGGGQRPLGIPTVRDRIVQQALLQVLEPIFESTFSNRSHGFRPSRGCTTALEVVDRAVRHGYNWVVDADIQSFFDRVDHEKLLTALNEEIADGSVLRLIRNILVCGVQMPETSQIEPTEMGTPQGGPLSPLLANVYLHAFDLAITQAGYGLVRYADDFVIFTKSENEATKALELCRQLLEEQWSLRLHPEKTKVVSVTLGFEFLGFRYFRDSDTGELRKQVRQKSVRRFRDRIRELTPRLHNQRRVKLHRLTLARLSRNKRLRPMIESVNRYLRSWHEYFKQVWDDGQPTFPTSDSFVRRRLRASITGRHGAGVLNYRLPNKLLAGLGLVSLVNLQRKYQQSHLLSPARKG